MTEKRTRGAAVAAVVATVAVMAAACSSNAQDGGKPRTAAAGASARAASPSAVETSEDPYPHTAQGNNDRAIDQKAAAEGWTYDTATYPTASAFVQDICDSLPVSAKEGATRPQWLVESGTLDGDGKALLQFGIPKLCPTWSATLKQAVSGNYDRWFGDGNYEVKSTPGPDDVSSDVQQIAAGRYRARGDLANCYWERTYPSGAIIANSYSTQASTISVTVRAGELFHAEGCGTWKPAK